MKQAYLVISLHLLLVWMLFYTDMPIKHEHKRPTARAKVHTMQLLPVMASTPTPAVENLLSVAAVETPPIACVAPLTPSLSVSPPLPTPAPPPPVAPPPETKSPVTQIVVPSAGKKPPPTPTKPSVQTQKTATLVSSLQKSLASLEQKQSAIMGTTGLAIPRSQSSLPTLASESLAADAHYEEALILYLEALLLLPEKGDVKIRLTLERSGLLQKVEFTSAITKKTRTYLEKNLSACVFPPFGTYLPGKKTHTFSITLTHK